MNMCVTKTLNSCRELFSRYVDIIRLYMRSYCFFAVSLAVFFVSLFSLRWFWSFFILPSIVKQWMTAAAAAAAVNRSIDGCCFFCWYCYTFISFSPLTLFSLSLSLYIFLRSYSYTSLRRYVMNFRRTFVQWRCMKSLLFAAIPLYFNNFFILLCTRALIYSQNAGWLSPQIK